MTKEIIERCVSVVRSKELTQYNDIVIEVIKQLREPTQAMLDAYGDYGTLDIDAYHAMVDAILNGAS